MDSRLRASAPPRLRASAPPRLRLDTRITFGLFSQADSEFPESRSNPFSLTAPAGVSPAGARKHHIPRVRAVVPSGFYAGSSVPHRAPWTVRREVCVSTSAHAVAFTPAFGASRPTSGGTHDSERRRVGSGAWTEDAACVPVSRVGMGSVSGPHGAAYDQPEKGVRRCSSDLRRRAFWRSHSV